MAMRIFEGIEEGRASPTVDDMAESAIDDVVASPSVDDVAMVAASPSLDDMAVSPADAAGTSTTAERADETPASSTSTKFIRSKRGLFSKARKDGDDHQALDHKALACRRSRRKQHLMKVVDVMQEDSSSGCNQDVFLLVVNRDDGLGYFTGTSKFRANFKTNLPICQYLPSIKDANQRKKRKLAVDTNNFAINPDNAIPPVPESPQRPSQVQHQHDHTPHQHQPTSLRQRQLFHLDALQLHQGNSLSADPHAPSAYVSRTRSSARPT